MWEIVLIVSLAQGAAATLVQKQPQQIHEKHWTIAHDSNMDTISAGLEAWKWPYLDNRVWDLASC